MLGESFALSLEKKLGAAVGSVVGAGARESVMVYVGTTAPELLLGGEEDEEADEGGSRWWDITRGFMVIMAS